MTVLNDTHGMDSQLAALSLCVCVCVIGQGDGGQTATYSW